MTEKKAMTRDVARIILREKLALWETTRSIKLASEICQMLIDSAIELG